jgi:hypothetical protein
MMEDSKIIEGPAGFGMHKPDGEEKLPTKNYPGSSKLPVGKGTKIEGPCDGKHQYTK